MATLNEIAYNAINLIRGGRTSDDDDISIRQVKHMIHYHRANLLMNYTSNGRYLHPSVLQYYAASSSELDSDFVKYNVKRVNAPRRTPNRMDVTKFTKIPPIVSFNQGRGIAYIGLRKDDEVPYYAQETNNIPIHYTTYNKFQFEYDDRFTGHLRRAFIHQENNDLSIYVTNVRDTGGTQLDRNPLELEIQAVFSNPTDIPGFDDDATPYPFPSELEGVLIQNLLAKEFGVITQGGTDIVNDAKNDLAGHHVKSGAGKSPGKQLDALTQQMASLKK